MRNRQLFSALLSLLLLPCCQQHQQLDHCVLEEVRFNGYEHTEPRKVLSRLMAFMEEQERSCERDADELAEKSLLILGNSPAAVLSEDELEEAEEAYLELEEESRIRLAADVMDALLSSPMRSVGSKQLRSYDRLDVSSLQQKAGVFFTPCEDQCIDTAKTLLFKRMVARIMLEDVACNPALEMDERCAAVICLQYICREAMLSTGGTWKYCYMIDALPLKQRNSEPERALLGS